LATWIKAVAFLDRDMEEGSVSPDWGRREEGGKRHGNPEGPDFRHPR